MELELGKVELAAILRDYAEKAQLAYTFERLRTLALACPEICKTEEFLSVAVGRLGRSIAGAPLGTFPSDPRGEQQ